MVEETIRAIRETEKEAEEIIRKANEMCAGILEEAEAKGKKIKEQAKADADKKAKDSFDVIKNIEEKSLQDTLDSVDAEIAAMKELAKAKEAEAISAVISQLV